MYDSGNCFRQMGVPAAQTPLSEIVCWTRMQAEAGQPLTDIVARKDAERVANGGVFCWGVGNPPSRALGRVREGRHPIDVVFSVMKSRPKERDARPSEVLVWNSYFDQYGAPQALPEASLVTSRADTLTGSKRAHYALICCSNDRLAIGDFGAFDPSAYRNVSEEAGPIGSSQVTALVRRVEDETTDTTYRINMRARLAGAGWVRLTGASRLSAQSRAKLDALESRVPQGAEWADLVSEIRRSSALLDSYGSIQPSLF